jgi:hypothetical protein
MRDIVRQKLTHTMASPSERVSPQYDRLSFGLGLQFLSPICIYLCPLALDKILQAF